MKKSKNRFKLQEPLPKSREEALANPIRVVALHPDKNGNFDPERGIGWIELNRPMSLEYDCGIMVKEPTICGELECTAD